MIDSVFDLFTQAHTTLARAEGGLGIGLTLVRALVELHGGDVRAESAGVGQGSTFTVRLPVASAEPKVRLPAAPAANGEASLRILVVDDNQDAAQSLGDILRLMGHHAEVVFSPIAALQVASDVDPELVLLDIGLPDMDGYEVARRLRRMLRATCAWSHLRVAERRRTSAAREAGFDEHVTKPLMPEAIDGILKRAIPVAELPGSITRDAR